MSTIAENFRRSYTSEDFRVYGNLLTIVSLSTDQTPSQATRAFSFEGTSECLARERSRSGRKKLNVSEETRNLVSQEKSTVFPRGHLLEFDIFKSLEINTFVCDLDEHSRQNRGSINRLLLKSGISARHLSEISALKTSSDKLQNFLKFGS